MEKYFIKRNTKNNDKPETSSNYNKENIQEQNCKIGELDSFILNSINQPKDRIFLLKLDKELENFIKNASKTTLTFPKFNTYQRLIIHKTSHYFGLTHVTNNLGQIVLYKTVCSKIPAIRISDLIVFDDPNAGENLSDNVSDSSENSSINNKPKLKIMKRPQSNPKTENKKNFPNKNIVSSDSDSTANKEEINDIRFKPIEERELVYQKARERIFNQNKTESPQEKKQVYNETPKKTKHLL